MTPDLLREIGESLYGPRWQSDLARALFVADRTIRRWDQGVYPVPPSVLPELRALLVGRRREMKDILARFPQPRS